MNSRATRALIFRILDDSPSKRDIGELVHLSAAFSLAFLRSQLHSGKIYFNIHQRGSHWLDDVALDSVASLFGKGSTGRLDQLHNYFQPLRESFERDPDLSVIHLRRLVISKTRQQLTRIFRDDDPAGWAIYRNLQMVPKRHSDVATIDDFHTTYYYHLPSVGLVKQANLTRYRHMAPIGSEILQECLSRAGTGGRNIPQIVTAVLRELAQDSHYRPFVARDKLFRGLRSLQGLKIVPLEEHHVDYGAANSAAALSDLDKQNCLDNVLQELERNISGFYIQTGKITPEEAIEYKSILHDYFFDLLTVGRPGNLPEYMDRYHIRGAGAAQRRAHRQRLDYLTRIGKKRLRNIILREVFRIS